MRALAWLLQWFFFLLGLFFGWVALMVLLRSNEVEGDAAYQVFEEKRHRQSTPFFRAAVLFEVTAGLCWLFERVRRPVHLTAGLVGFLLLVLGCLLGLLYIWQRQRAGVELDSTENWPREPFREKWAGYPLYRCTILCQFLSLASLILYNL